MSETATLTSHAFATRRPVKTALHQAVLDHRLHQVRLIVRQNTDNVDEQDVFGRTPLMLASLLDNEHDGYRMARIFLEADAFVSMRDSMNRTALHYACMKGRERLVKRFLKSVTADINAPDNDGNTPLMHAALSGRPDVVQLVVKALLRVGMPVDARNSLGYTALLLSCMYGHFASAHVLLTDGSASPALRDNEFFLNALGWLRKSLVPRFEQENCASLSCEVPPRFARENRMYSKFNAPACHHGKPVSSQWGMSMDSALRLPAIFSHVLRDADLEAKVEGADAKQVLLQELETLMQGPKYRPVSKPSDLSRAGSLYPGMKSFKSHPSTAKLMSMRPGHKSKMVLDMRTLLDLYSDQYAARLLAPPVKVQVPPPTRSGCLPEPSRRGRRQTGTARGPIRPQTNRRRGSRASRHHSQAVDK